MKLIITEKPSVARDIAKVLKISKKRRGWIQGKEVWITWCVGHLASLKYPEEYRQQWKSWVLEDLPIIPNPFELKVIEETKDQWEQVYRLIQDSKVSSLVNACDAGREGELIFRNIYEMSQTQKPFERFWTSSLTEEAILEAWKNLRPGRAFDALAYSAQSRSRADWLVGINMTRALTLFAQKHGAGGMLSVGRVQTPTLAMIVQRDREIESFKPQKFWEIRGRFELSESIWTGTWFQVGRYKGKFLEPKLKTEDYRRKGKEAQRVYDRAIAEQMAQAILGQKGKIAKVQKKRKVEKPPLLYDLTSLQRQANQKYGFSAKKTLDLAQSLYEKRKILTYPRTDSNYLTTDQRGLLKTLVESLKEIPSVSDYARTLLSKGLNIGKHIIDDDEVSDHHAILPTKRLRAFRELTPDEGKIFDLVIRRLLAVLSPPAIFDLTTVVVEVMPSKPLPKAIQKPLKFQSFGKIRVQLGWQAIELLKAGKDTVLPDLKKGQEVQVQSSKVHEGQTRPPNRFNDASILRAMETAGRQIEDRELKRYLKESGLGTPATRAETIQKLLSRRFVERKSKALISTQAGRALIDLLPVEDLKSPVLTGEWEKRLAAIAKGNEDPQRFIRDVSENLKQMIQRVKEAPPNEALTRIREFYGRGKVMHRYNKAAENLGPCPECGAPVREQDKVYLCDEHASCTFIIYKEISQKQIGPEVVSALLKEGRTPLLTGFRSKKGRTFEAFLLWDKQEKRVRFEFPNQYKSPVGMRCPKCGQGTIIRGRQAWGCSRWREKCDFVLPFKFNDRVLSDAEAVQYILDFVQEK